jgi:hypothetical protein
LLEIKQIDYKHFDKKGVMIMTTLSINLTDEQKDFLTNYAKDKNTNITDLFTLFVEYLEKLEDAEDYNLGVTRILDPNNKPCGTMKELASEFGIDYDEL